MVRGKRLQGLLRYGVEFKTRKQAVDFIFSGIKRGLCYRGETPAVDGAERLPSAWCARDGDDGIADARSLYKEGQELFAEKWHVHSKNEIQVCAGGV